METSLDKEHIIQARYQIKEYAQLILSFFIVVTGILLFLFFIKPTYVKYTNNKLEISSQLQQEVILDSKLSELQKAKSLQASLDDNISLVRQSVPDDSDIPTVMAMVLEMASKSGVKVSTFSYIGLGNSIISLDKPSPVATDSSTSADTSATGLDSPINSDYFDAFNLSISVLGKFTNLSDFVKKIENSRRLLDISGFSYSIEKDNQQITSDFYTLKVQLTAYYRSFADVEPRVALDQYSRTLSDLNDMIFYEVDLSNTTVGKEDPFNTGGTEPGSSPTSGASGAGTTSGTSFFGGPANNSGSTDSGTNNTQNPGVNVVEPAPDQEAQPGDVQKLLQDMLLKEGL